MVGDRLPDTDVDRPDGSRIPDMDRSVGDRLPDEIDRRDGSVAFAALQLARQIADSASVRRLESADLKDDGTLELQLLSIERNLKPEFIGSINTHISAIIRGKAGSPGIATIRESISERELQEMIVIKDKEVVGEVNTPASRFDAPEPLRTNLFRYTVEIKGLDPTRVVNES